MDVVGEGTPIPIPRHDETGETGLASELNPSTDITGIANDRGQGSAMGAQITPVFTDTVLGTPVWTVTGNQLETAFAEHLLGKNDRYGKPMYGRLIQAPGAARRW